jgi:hypothetical protein
MDVGDKQSAKAPLWALFTHIVTSHAEQLSDFRDSAMTIDEACGTTCGVIRVSRRLPHAE